ncbi:hypothetical protein, partial [Wolbachia endosymbiont of Bemisia tabaci]|uniref:hypothetical protein n=1 Tax=Wolbachia endosymbiont of Bemisia tabaci TaxID=215173 RepID=UPI00131EE4EE
MPGSDKDKPGILEGVQKAAQEPFVNTLIYKVGESFANTIIPSTIPVISFLNSPVAAAAGAVGCYFVNEAKRKATSDSTKEIEYGVREHSDDFQYSLIHKGRDIFKDETNGIRKISEHVRYLSNIVLNL